MDADVLKKAVVAHHKATGGLTATNPVLSEADLILTDSTDRSKCCDRPHDRISSESQTMDVYTAFSAELERMCQPTSCPL